MPQTQTDRPLSPATQSASTQAAACPDNLWRITVSTHRAHTTERFGKPVSGSFPTVVRSYRSAVTRHINILSN
ncbi:MAG: hypothetical protein D3904_18190 [Candidatus Electrothrix sp. EH2]|nr:hypothetical protein [Candidatus Electrothrix sp. EH2]